MNIGYARVSTLDQNLDLQMQALKKGGRQKDLSRRGISAAVVPAYSSSQHLESRTLTMAHLESLSG